MRRMILFPNDEAFLQFPKDFFSLIFVAAVLLLGNDENTKFLFCQKSFHMMEIRCNQSYRRHLLLQETKARINSYV